MLSLLASLALLAVMGALGVSSLRRAALGLEPLEQVAYGVPLGAVAATLVLIPLASIFGLSAALVVLVGCGCGASAVLLWPGRPWLAIRHAPKAVKGPWFGQVGFLPASPRTQVQASVVPTVVIGALVLRWVFFWRSALEYDAAGLWAGHTFLFSDWPTHLGDTTSFAYGDNFPPENPRLPGHPFAYHYLGSVTAAALVKLKLDPSIALELPSFFGSVAIALGVYAFARRLTRDAAAATLTVVLFLFGGSLAWLITGGDINRLHSVKDGLLQDPWNFSRQVDGNLHFGPYFFRTASERGYSYGLPLALLTLTLLLIGVRTGQRRAFVATGVVVGLMPLAHLSSLMALALITPFLFLLFPSRKWFLALGVAILVAAPQLYSQVGSGGGAASGIRFHVGWLAPPDPWLWFWVKNLGWFLPLLALALADRTLVPPETRRFLWGFMPVFILANLIAFQPWVGDNLKVLMYWFLAVCVLTGVLLTRAWREHQTPVVRALIVGVIATMTLTGALANLDQLLGKDRFLIMDTEDLRFAESVRAETPMHARFLIGLQYYSPVSVLTGRQVVMGYPGHAIAYGIYDVQRERDVRAMYEFGPDTPMLLAKYKVDYVVIGPGEREVMDPNEPAFRSRYPVVIETEDYVVFDVGMGSD